MRALVLGMTIALLSPRPVQDGEASIEEELEALVEKVNAHDSFRLLYRGSGETEGDTHEVTLEIVYLAPDRARVRLEAAENSSVHLVLDRDIFVRADGAEWRRARIPSCAALSRFEELLPTEGAIAPGVVFHFRGGAEFRLSVGRSELGRRCFLGPFSAMIEHAEDVSAEEQLLVWRNGTLTLAVSRVTGMLQSIEVTDGESRMHVELEEVELDRDVTEELELPPEARECGVDAELQSTFDEQQASRNVRGAAFQRLSHQIRRGALELDARTRADLVEFLELLHTEGIDGQWGEWRTQLQGYVDEFMTWAREVRSREIVEPHASERREKLEAGFQEALDFYEGALAELEDFDLSDEVLDLELEVVRRLHDKLVSGPILDSWDKQLEAALDD